MKCQVGFNDLIPIHFIRYPTYGSKNVNEILPKDYLMQFEGTED